MAKKILIALLMFVCCGTIGVSAQQKGKIFVESFEKDQFDLTAKDPKYSREDYAIIKLTSSNPDDNLKEYNFNFGYPNHYVVEHGDELWVYVQRNAKMMTISRKGYVTLSRYDLHTTIERGVTYRLVLSSSGPRVEYQMLKFTIQPQVPNMEIKLRSEGSGMTFSLRTDATGTAARNMPLGIYTYTIETPEYKRSEGRISLANKHVTHEERVALIPDFEVVTLTVGQDADIYVYGEKRGTRTWTGRLGHGVYHVECKQAGHRDASQTITVAAGGPRTFQLSAPQPITGTLSVSSNPLGAHITIDGRDYGTTPRNIEGLLVGTHKVEVSKANYKTENVTVNISEGMTCEISPRLSDFTRMTISSQPSGANLYIDGKRVGATPYTAEMTSGEYDIRLTHHKYNELKKRVHLDSSNPDVMFKLYKNYIRRSTLYLEGFFQTGMSNGYGGAVGFYIRNFNVEYYFDMLIGQDELYDNNPDADIRASVFEYKMGMKLGYGINVSNRIRITPQLGIMSIRRETTSGYSSSSSSDAGTDNWALSIGARCELWLTRHCGISLTPEGHFAISTDGATDAMMSASSKAKQTIDGLDVKLGFFVNF